MAINWDLYQSKLTIRGTTKAERQINYVKNAISNNFQNDPSCRSVYINNVTTPQNIIVLDSGYDNDKYNIKTILSDPDETFYVGDVIYLDTLTYLVTEIDEGNQIQTKGTMQLCTTTLSLYKNHILLQFPAIISSEIRLYSMGTENNKYFLSNDDEIIVTISDNVNSQYIEVNDIFHIGDRHYVVQSIQDVVKSGLLILKMKVTVEEVVSHVFVVEILNNSGVLDVDDTLTLNCIATDNGVLDSSPALSYLSSNTSVATVSSTGVVTAKSVGTSTITVGYGSVSDTLSITVQSESASDGYKVSVSGANTVKLGSNIVLSATVFNNGSIISDSVTWSITNNDASSNVYLSLVSSTSSTITLKATLNSSYVGQYVTIRASKSDNVTVYDDFVVQIRSIF